MDTDVAFTDHLGGVAPRSSQAEEGTAQRTDTDQRQFLLGLVAGDPDWRPMKCPHLSQLPAIRWKPQNLATLKKSNSRKFNQ
ncbi:MAG TPA: hypothetical protein VMP11_13460 [Verrucomicrobiae bacterium]|nr:hypothetical protein [Verrucomicrobiae bacterium]